MTRRPIGALHIDIAQRGPAVRVDHHGQERGVEEPGVRVLRAREDGQIEARHAGAKLSADEAAEQTPVVIDPGRPTSVPTQRRVLERCPAVGIGHGQATETRPTDGDALRADGASTQNRQDPRHPGAHGVEFDLHACRREQELRRRDRLPTTRRDRHQRDTEVVARPVLAGHGPDLKVASGVCARRDPANRNDQRTRERHAIGRANPPRQHASLCDRGREHVEATAGQVYVVHRDELLVAGHSALADQ